MSTRGRKARRSLGELRDNAAEALARYTDPAGHYSFHTYDRQGSVEDAALTPADVLSANLLSLRLGWREVVPLFAEGQGEPQDLLRALNTALATLRTAPAFEDHDTLEALEETVAPLAAANDAALPVPKWTHVTVSKVLHRRLPHIVPIIDSRVRAFYGARGPKSVRAALWEDLQEHQGWVADLAQGHQTPDERPLSVLRCADVLIWSAD